MKIAFNQFSHVQLHEDPTMVTKTVTRVRGGHMNRWLIRTEVIEPRLFARIVGGRLCAHPAVIDRVRAELRAAGDFSELQP